MSRNIALTPKASLQIGLVSTACKYQPSAKRIFALFSKWWNDMKLNYDFQQRYLWTSLDTFIDAAQPITKKENWTKGDLRFVELLSERLIRESGRLLAESANLIFRCTRTSAVWPTRLPMRSSAGPSLSRSRWSKPRRWKSGDLRIIEPDMRKLNVNLQVCKTVYDTITEQKCEISYETVYDEVARVFTIIRLV